MAKKHSFDLYQKVEDFFLYNLPQLPSTSSFARFLPWMALIEIIFIPYALTTLNTTFNKFMSTQNIASFLLLVLTFTTIVLPIILSLSSIPFLWTRAKRGWNLFFCAFILSYIANFAPVLKPLDVFIELIVLYIIFQVKREYT